MEKIELDRRLKELKLEFERKKKEAIKEYCLANNPYKKGDIFTDHIGSIIIEKIMISVSSSVGFCCYYEGSVLNKDGSKRKDNKKRNAYQLNDVKLEK